MSFPERIELADSVWIETAEALGYEVTALRGPARDVVVRPYSDSAHDGAVLAVKRTEGKVVARYDGDSVREVVTKISAGLTEEERDAAVALVGARVKTLTDRAKQLGDVVFVLLRPHTDR